MADESGLVWKSLDDVFTTARTFLDPILAGGDAGRWDHRTWRWMP